MKSYPLVSFIIPTLNAQEFLPLCLAAIRSQNYPKNKIEIIIADGGSTDNTISIANKYNAKIVKNPEILHEPGKSIASRYAKGEILFYTDSDNILSSKNWLTYMVTPYIDDETIRGYLPITIPAPDTNNLDRYFGFLCTDPFTWFVYGNAASPRDFEKIFSPVKRNKNYIVYKFPENNYPIFGLSQGVGTLRTFKRDGIAYADDLMAGIKLIQEGGLVAYVPNAGVYHYHIKSYRQFVHKYSWRVKNNLQQRIKGMGLVNRVQFLNNKRKLRMYVFVPYAFSIVFPLVDTLRLVIRFQDEAMLWHLPASITVAVIIVVEYINSFLGKKPTLSQYE